MLLPYSSGRFRPVAPFPLVEAPTNVVVADVECGAASLTWFLVVVLLGGSSSLGAPSYGRLWFLMGSFLTVVMLLGCFPDVCMPRVAGAAPLFLMWPFVVMLPGAPDLCDF